METRNSTTGGRRGRQFSAHERTSGWKAGATALGRGRVVIQRREPAAAIVRARKANTDGSGTDRSPMRVTGTATGLPVGDVGRGKPSGVSKNVWKSLFELYAKTSTWPLSLIPLTSK